MYTISKSFQGSYGHRVFTQNVNPEYAGDNQCPCQRIHGHNYDITVGFRSAEIDDRGFVIDFKELHFIKEFLDDNVDHRFIVSTLDPNYEQLVGHPPADSTLRDVTIMGVVAGGRFNVDPSDVHLDSFFVVDFNPTSEELSRWIYQLVVDVVDRSPFNIIVDSVTWSETPKTAAVFSGE